MTAIIGGRSASTEPKLQKMAKQSSPAALAARRAAGSLFTFVLTAAVLIALWVLFLRVVNVGRYVGKTPADVWEYLSKGPKAAANRKELLEASRTTLWQALIGYIAGTIAAVTVAVLFVLSRSFERAVMPIALALRSVPVVAMIPLLAYVFGRDLLGSIVIVSIIVWFPTLVLVTFGLRSVTAQQLDLMRALDARSWHLFTKVRLQTALPSLFAAAKVAAPAAILGALINGWLSTGDGLGNMMLLSTTSGKYNRLWAAVVIVTLLSMLLAALINTAEGIVLARYAPDRLTERT